MLVSFQITVHLKTVAIYIYKNNNLPLLSQHKTGSKIPIIITETEKYTFNIQTLFLMTILNQFLIICTKSIHLTSWKIYWFYPPTTNNTQHGNCLLPNSTTIRTGTQKVRIREVKNYQRNLLSLGLSSVYLSLYTVCNWLVLFH